MKLFISIVPEQRVRRFLWWRSHQLRLKKIWVTDESGATFFAEKGRERDEDSIAVDLYIWLLSAWERYKDNGGTKDDITIVGYDCAADQLIFNSFFAIGWNTKALIQKLPLYFVDLAIIERFIANSISDDEYDKNGEFTTGFFKDGREYTAEEKYRMLLSHIDYPEIISRKRAGNASYSVLLEKFLTGFIRTGFVNETKQHETDHSEVGEENQSQ
jgi:hypothetical protein